MKLRFQQQLNGILQLKEKYNSDMEKHNASPETIPAPEGSMKSLEMSEKLLRNMYGDYSKGRLDMKEAIMTTDVVPLIPRIIEGKLVEAAEPEYLATNFFTKIKMDGGSTSAVYVVPIVGELTATEVGEGARYREDAVEFTTMEQTNIEIRAKKIGVKVSISEEAIQDSTWDILGLNIRKMGRAMARYKEEWMFNEFSTKGHTMFDNNVRVQNPEAGTRGRGADMQFNDTLAVEDFLDLVLGIMANGFNPTDVIMHPLTWVVFARNSMLGNGLSFGALGGQSVHPNNAIQGTGGFAGMMNSGLGQKMIMDPSQVENRLPVPLQVSFSPYVPFDKQNKRFDMYCVDREEVGVLLEKEGLSTTDWADPETDMRNLKAKERYGIGILNNGRAITVARNIAVDVSYPEQPTISLSVNE